MHVDPFLFSLTKKHFILLVITADDFLVVRSQLALIQLLHETFTSKYVGIRLGKPTEFLGRSVANTPLDAIFLSQPALEQATI